MDAGMPGINESDLYGTGSGVRTIDLSMRSAPSGELSSSFTMKMSVDMMGEELETDITVDTTVRLMP